MLIYKLFAPNASRKDYMTNILGIHGKTGTIKKFNNAIGFKPIVDEWVDYDYDTPHRFLMKAAHINLSPNGIIEFHVDATEMKHENPIYSYNTKEMVERFIRFLHKVYPDIICVQTCEPPVDTYANRIRDFMCMCAYEDDVTIEISGERLLADEEIDYVLEGVKQVTNTPFKIEQFWCETCAGYHADHPIHISLVV